MLVSNSRHSLHISLLDFKDIDEIVTLSQQFFPKSRAYTHQVHRNRVLDLYFDNKKLNKDCAPLVCKTEYGQIIGFLGVNYSTFQFKERFLRVAHCHHLFATELGRKQLVPLRLLQHFLAGPQDLSFADGSSNSTRLLWDRLGGEVVLGESIYFNIPLRPISCVARMMLKSTLNVRLANMIRSLAKYVDVIGSRLGGQWFYIEPPKHTLEKLSESIMIDLMHRIQSDFDLFPAYTEQYLAKQFHLLENETRFGTLHKMVILDDSSSPIGWFIYFAKKDGVCEVIQAVSLPGFESDLYRALRWHAQSQGGVELSGRLMRNQFQTPFTTKSISLPARMWTLIKCDDLALKHSIQSGRAFLTRLDGDLWVL
jgi:hypothetical protein